MTRQTATDPALWELTADQLHARYRRKTATPVDVVGAVLQRIEDVNPLVNAFAVIDREGARAAAEASAKRWATGEPLGRLDGVPLSIKDNITVRGLPCRWGTEVFRDFVPDRDETPVARLRAAGAIILGKTTTSEFSNGRGIVSTPMFGTTRNPWRPTLTTGSSSAGAAAAAATGMGAIAIGTDGGGSIRLPASHCGLLGFKPTAGRVARAHGLPMILAGREVVGPLLRSTADLSAVLRVMAGPCPEDAASWGLPDLPGDEPDPNPRSQRILHVKRLGDYPVAPEVTAACDRVAGNLEALGHQVIEGEAPFDIERQARNGVVIRAGMAWLLRDKDWVGRTHDYYAGLVEEGSRLSAADYIDALDALRQVQAQMGRFFETYDLMLSPVACQLPGPADVPAPAHYGAFTGVANTAGVPAVAIPAELSPDGLPIGFQLIGRFGADWPLLAMARQYELHHPWADRRPPLWHGR
ncbi:MAG TPA: amidase [Candidatus Sulfotelmatobacter sp.]|nr:amidase [Candidatus Sulfotelmatobacter sp.]